MSRLKDFWGGDRGFWACLGAFAVFALAAILTGSLVILLIGCVPLVIIFIKLGPGRTPIDSSAGSGPYPPFVYEETEEWREAYRSALAELDVEFPTPKPVLASGGKINCTFSGLYPLRKPGTPIPISSPAEIPFLVDGGYEAQRVRAIAEADFPRWVPLEHLDDYLVGGE